MRRIADLLLEGLDKALRHQLDASLRASQSLSENCTNDLAVEADAFDFRVEL